MLQSGIPLGTMYLDTYVMESEYLLFGLFLKIIYN